VTSCDHPDYGEAGQSRARSPSAHPRMYVLWCFILFLFSLGLFSCCLSDVLPDELFAMLGRFHVGRGSIHAQLGDIDRLYSKFAKEHYLTRSKISTGHEMDTYRVTWGPRAHLELAMSQLADTLAAIMNVERTADFLKQLERASGIASSVFGESVEASLSSSTSPHPAS
jgi:hypothetical protein